MMTLDEALHYIHAVCWKGSIPGLERITALLTACRDRLRPNGLIVVSAVTLESFGTLLSWAPDHRAGLCRIDIANERPLAKTSHHLTPQNTIYVFTFHKEAIS